MAMNSDPNNSAQDAAQDEAAQVTGKAQDAAKETADTARQEARQVADEATTQVKSLASSAQDEAMSQAATQQERLAEQSRTVTDDLQALARGEQPESGLVSQAVSALADRAEQFTTQLETKEPADLLKDVRRFAARRPGAFLAIAAGVGLAAGRLTRGLSDSDDEDTEARQTPDRSAPPAVETADTTALTSGYPGTAPAAPISDYPADTATGAYPDDLMNPGERR